MGLGASHPHSFQFLPVIIAVSFDPFSVTLCSPSWYDFSLLCPPLLFPPQQTTQMRNPRYWWTGRMLKTNKQTKNKQTKTKKENFILSLQNISLSLLCCCSPSGGARALVCDAAAAAAGCFWSVWPPERGLWSWLPVENTDQPPTCPEPCPLHSLPLTFTYQEEVVMLNKPPIPHI